MSIDLAQAFATPSSSLRSPSMSDLAYQPPDEVLERLVQWKLLQQQAEARARELTFGAVDQVQRRLYDMDELASLPEPTWLLDGLLPSEGLAFLVGQPGAYKSFFALQLSVAVAAGVPLLGLASAPGSVIYVAAEGIGGMKQRFPVARDRMVGAAPFGYRIQFDTGPVDLLSHASVDDLADRVIEQEARLVVIDTLARCTPGADENSSKDMGIAVRGLDRLKAQGCCVLVVHHSTKSATGDSVRGSSALRGAADTVLEMVKSNGLVDLRTLKQKDAAEANAMKLALNAWGSSAYLELATPAEIATASGSHGRGPVDEVVRAAIEANPGISQARLVEMVGQPKSSVRRAVARLREGAEVAEERGGRGVTYRLVSPNA